MIFRSDTHFRWCEVSTDNPIFLLELWGFFYSILRFFIKITVSVKTLMMGDRLRFASFMAKISLDH